MSLSLYRRYRPEIFPEVIGQSHVTQPLQNALKKNYINHAYLFSGPRGCGKTTSARILARSLNCHAGVSEIPCAICPSCIDLATGSTGSIDVVEIDAASHGGVDDTRELREKTLYAPVRDRYKIFIIDEAHMVTSAGFNALLKVVEEPPPHIKFIFATTEPEKVIGTIRSRTHHYPFRLVAPEILQNFLAEICVKENIVTEAGVLPLVIKAAAGSVRDALSILDQLIAGADSNKLDYSNATNLLGYTNVSLVNELISCFISRNARDIFSNVNQIIQTGQDLRRFVEDLLEHFRNILLVKSLKESASSVLTELPKEQLVVLEEQAGSFSFEHLSNMSDTINDTLNTMLGSITPRINLEILCAKILLITSESSLPTEPSLEISQNLSDTLKYTPNSNTKKQLPTTSSTKDILNSQLSSTETEENISNSLKIDPILAKKLPQKIATSNNINSRNIDLTKHEQIPALKTDNIIVTSENTATNIADPTEVTFKHLKDSWDEVLLALSRMKRASWILVKQNSRVVDLRDNIVTIAFQTAGLADTFMRNGHDRNLQAAITKILEISYDIKTVVITANTAQKTDIMSVKDKDNSEPFITSQNVPPTSYNTSEAKSPWALQTAPNANIPWTLESAKNISDNANRTDSKRSHIVVNNPSANQTNETSETDKTDQVSEVFGLEAIQKILGGTLVEEIPIDPLSK